jgi:hypothetical protein
MEKICDISSQKLYVVGCHGCAPRKLLQGEKNLDSKRFFIVPDNITIVYFNSNGVLSEGSKNIPFLKNLYDYNKPMLNYILNPSNYNINLDKTKPNSYRHKDFFKSLPFFSNFNYLCNFELYPPGVKCPNVHLSFTMNESSKKSSYFEGITPLDNIIFETYRKKLEFKNTKMVHNPIKHLNEKAEGFVYTNNLMKILKNKFELKSGVFFISSCRAEYYTNYSNGITTLVNLHPVDRNCEDINYDIKIIDSLIEKYPNSMKSLNDVKKRLNDRDDAKKSIYKEIIDKYLQNDKFWQNNFINDLYKLFNVNDINICVNFNKIQINKSQNESIYKHVDNIFFKIRSYLHNNLLHMQNENINNVLYRKLGYLQYLTLNYIPDGDKQLPSNDIFNKFNNDVEDIPNTTTDNDKSSVLSNILKKYNNKKRKRINLKKKYLKYKQKYLKLKNKLN